MQAQAKAIRSFHNRIKTDLLQRFGQAQTCTTLLDVGVGRGGDIMKWYNAGIHNVVGLDVEPEYVKEAVRRYRQAKLNAHTKYKFHVIKSNDTFITTLQKNDLPMQYDIVSCQFCLHYFASSEEHLHEFFRSVSNVLKPNGVFVGTVPCGSSIIELLDGNAEFSNDQVLIKKNCDSLSPQCGDSIQFSMTGTLYFGESMVSHEFLVYKDLVQYIAMNYGLKLIEWKSFSEYHYDDTFNLSSASKTASFINKTFVFKKRLCTAFD